MGTILNTGSTKRADQFEKFRDGLLSDFLCPFSSKEIERTKRDFDTGSGQSVIEERFIRYCTWNNHFLEMAKQYFASHKLSQEERYAFIKQAYIKGFSKFFCFEGAGLLEPETYQLFDIDLMIQVMRKNDFYILAQLLQYNRSKKLIDFLKQNSIYINNDGYVPRNIVELMQTPQDIDYGQEVKQNDFIDVFNVLYDDACVYENCPSEIIGLASLPNKKYLNQDNLISLAKSLYDWGTGLGTPTYAGVREYYETLTRRSNEGALTLYDYQSDTLRNMKAQLGDIVDSTKSQAPYTSYVLNQFGTRTRCKKKIDTVLEELILFYPEETRHVYIKR